ncbi:uncharacterized protein CANTADRAFT_6949 [Suhomyces tanzawaensis NRRL Y-17324]|uniref:Fatty acid synthase subunit alpha n=1 Tax=Suhomyces tanzawaensis NRRL Y-17324 TaxID=984487 RepID=A0A1E4SGJ6_9ASCO|nr:uncharacterized protein CANTADRAFT_6949 [Suhomyces tanzawaensis NRRL Y-17324]ODV78590.1 hypothetical protein CANTADRAFT_6949 [Suhomyces tanzawaensis NRRL Y-17324]
MIQNLPAEITLSIACLLEQNDALHLSYTCRHLHRIVQPRLFFAIVVDSSKKVYNKDTPTKLVKIPSFGDRAFAIIPTVISSLYSLNTFFKQFSKYPWLACHIRYMSFSEIIPDISDLFLIENLEKLLQKSSSLKVFHWYSHAFDLPSTLVSRLNLIQLHGNFTHTESDVWIPNSDLSTLNISNFNDPKWLAGLNLSQSTKLKELVISKTKTKGDDFKFHRGLACSPNTADSSDTYLSQLFSDFGTQSDPLHLSKLTLKGLTISAEEAVRLCECVDLEGVTELSILDCTEILPSAGGRMGPYNPIKSFLDVISPHLKNLQLVNMSLMNSLNYHNKTFNFLKSFSLKSLNITINVNNYENLDSKIEQLFESINGELLEFLNFDYNIVPAAMVHPSHKYCNHYSMSSVKSMVNFSKLKYLQLPVARYKISNLLPLLRSLVDLKVLSLNMFKYGEDSIVATKNVQTLISQEFLDFYAGNSGYKNLDTSQYENYIYDFQNTPPIYIIPFACRNNSSTNSSLFTMRPEVQQQLSHTLLTELLAYQFASPVRWIETQDVFLKEHNTERVVEVGPSPTLAGMASRTIKAKYESYDAALSLQRQVLCYSKDAKEIYYTPDPADLAPPAAPAAAEPATPAPVATPAPSAAAAAAVPPAAASAAPAPAPAAGPAASVSDSPVTAALVLQVLVAQKLKKPLDGIPMGKAIKDLVNGKSTVQNEILGDLGKEFGSTPEKPEDTPLEELAEQFQDTFNGQLGKTSTSLIGRLMSSKMPGGFSITNARKYLETRFGLGSGRQDGVLLVALTNEPAARLGSEAEAKLFLDTAANKYATIAGISLASESAGAGAGAGGAGGAVVDSAALDALTAENKKLAKQQLEVLARYLQVDLNKGAKSFIKEKEASAVLQKELDLWEAEHGEFYSNGIKPVFSPLKSRTYDSYWNWARQDVLSMYFDIIFGKLTSIDRETISQCIQIMNRSNPTLIKFMQYHIDHTPEYKGETYQLAKRLGQQLIDNCNQVMNVDPVYKDVSRITGPKTTIDAKGKIVFEEANKDHVRKFEQYVYEMAQGGKLTKMEPQPTIKEDLNRVYKAITKQASKTNKVEFQKLYDQLINFVESSKEIETKESTKSVLQAPTGTNTPTDEDELSTASDDEIASLPDKTSILLPVSSSVPPETIPFLHLQKKHKEHWSYDRKLSSIYLDGLESAAINGLSFKDKHVLVTGAGVGSIGAEILQGLICGGAKVVVTTSRFSKKVTEYYQNMYARYGASGSTLTVVPFNQGSKQDVDALIQYIYDEPKKGGLGWDLDAIIPFAAVPENGNGLDNLDSRSEFSHRVMLTNLLRLLGGVATKKTTDTRPAQVILPLSPNHGTFGFDGLYSESKISLETLTNRWYSEDWGSKLTICGAIIGWTRGTGLMSGNNIIAEGIEKLGVRTFSQKEMAFNILGLFTPEITQLCQEEPVMADLNGGLQFIENLKDFTNKLRTDLLETSDIRRAVSIEASIEQKVVEGANVDANYNQVTVQPRSNMKFEFPTLKSYKDIKAVSPDLEGMLDLEQVIVVTGFAEVGPWGNSRTRWEMEANGEFSLEGAIEMAWIMGLIKYHNGNLKGKPYSGWIDAKTQAPVDDKDIKSKYEEEILNHTGIRLIEPELFHGYDPKNKHMIQEVVIQQDMEPFETSKETALQYKHEHGEKCEIFEIEESGEYTVRFLKGATLYIPKALRFDRLVAGQIPTGWDARTYGISEDTISQVDPITLYVLVATVEALLSAGVTDPYEFYKYVHVSEVGNCSGSGMGGVTALRGMFKDRYADRPVQNDILQESFINTMSAWVNMLLLSSSGPIKTPVGACATAVESVDVGIETILGGKAKVCIVGGYDDFQEEGSYEFGNMNATSNSETEFAHGRTPKEMSRPTTTTRSGFMEAQGSGIQVIMTADLAVKMGVPIQAVLAMTATATDKIGRSVPAPGKGILTTAREHHGDLKYPTPMLNIKYRSRQLKQRLAQIKTWEESEINYLSEEAELAKQEYGAGFSQSDFLRERTEEVHREAKRQVSEAKVQWGNSFWRKDPRIAPLRGSLATFGLTVDDIGVASFHGTSTVANDKNESATINSMMKHLGRTEGNPVFGVFQKYLTGHPKGAAGAWMLNGAIQILNSGIVPGNRNADNVDKLLENYEYVLFPSRTIKTDGIKAVSVTSFGFGQKGAQAIVVHPDYLYAALDQSTYEAYATKVHARNKKTYRYMHNAITRNTMFVAKDKAPYADELEEGVYLDPLARIPANTNIFTKKNIQSKESYVGKVADATAKALSGLNKSSKGVGVDVELLTAINVENDTFIERNFTSAEREYCAKSAHPQASYTGTWSAKEAVFKALGVKSQGAGAALIDIEIVRDSNGAPKVNLNGSAAKAATQAGVKSVSISISHDDYQATAVALSEF